MDKLKLAWYLPKVQYKGKNYMQAWGEEMERLGFELIDGSSIAEADLVFFGSDSVLDPLVIGKKPTLCYFWGWSPYRFLDGHFINDIDPKVELMRRCTRVLVPSPTVVDQAYMLGLNAELCLPGVDARTLSTPMTTMRKEQVLFISRLEPHKNLGFLIDALSLLEPRPPLMVIGPGDPRPYQEQASALGVAATFMEASDEEKVREIRSSMVLVHPSLYEGFGLPPLESLLLQTPVISFDTPQARWLLQEDAYYFSSVEGLAQTIMQVLNQPEEALRKTEHGALRIAKAFTLEAASQRLWAHVHQTIKEFWGDKVSRAPNDKTLVREAYNAEARRNWAYGLVDVGGYNGPARFSPEWSRHWRAAAFLQALKGVEGQVLDAGCGPVYPTIFAKAGITVTAFDVADEVLAQVKTIAEKWGVSDHITLQQGYVQEMPFSDEAFSAVVLGEVLEHIPDPEVALKEAIRVTKKGGLVIASSPIGSHHYDKFHIASAKGGWDDEGIQRLLLPYRDCIVKVEQIAEEGTDPSCYLIVLRRPAD